LETPLWAEAARRVRGRHSNLDHGELRRAVLHELIDWQVSDLVECAIERITTFEIGSCEAARAAEIVVRPRDELAEQKSQLESFLFNRVYRHSDVLAHRAEAQGFLREMFAAFVRRPELLPERFRQRISAVGLGRTVGDYLAGMTDRFARREHDRMRENGGTEAWKAGGGSV
jgi:dGTPase